MTFPADVLALINGDDSAGFPVPATPSPEVLAERQKRLSVEDVEQIRQDLNAELTPGPEVEPEPELPPLDLSDDGRFAQWVASRGAR